jgi:hypothetical protein
MPWLSRRAIVMAHLHEAGRAPRHEPRPRLAPARRSQVRLTSHPECDQSATLPATRALAPSEVRTRRAAGGRRIRTLGRQPR